MTTAEAIEIVRAIAVLPTETSGDTGIYTAKRAALIAALKILADA